MLSIGSLDADGFCSEIGGVFWSGRQLCEARGPRAHEATNEEQKD